ncbi:EAL domain-containing protein [Yoonia sp. SS1-5]|uniref:Bifunctional diguanylate cyclase/phosphodiesterase n=1 Tax=Yoonia rhodophyticola TaxID=3137370 RepID=A0AAN0NJJ0_9RHOB
MTIEDDKVIRILDDFSGMASDWFWETDSEHRFCYFSRRMAEVTKFDIGALLGKKRDIIPAEKMSDPKWIAHKADLAAHRPFRNFEYKMHRPHDGTLLWIRIAGEPQFDADGTFVGYRGVGHDITDEKLAMQRLEESNAALAERNAELNEARRHLERSANEDALTGLFNRRAFERDIAHALQQTDQVVALLHVDLDRFKWVNDTFGHAAGDSVLRTASKRIQLALGDAGRPYRVGGDEFMVILRQLATDDLPIWLGDRIIEAMAKPIAISKQRVTIGASVGVATGLAGETRARLLISRADAALYEAKNGGRNMVCQVTPALQRQIDDRRSLASDIPRAIERGEFVPFFQPQIDVQTGRIIGAETLVRWQHPDRGMLPPGQFLQSAVELGLIDRIDHHMLVAAMQVSLRLREAGYPLPSLSVNVSEARLIDPLLPRQIDTLWIDRDCLLSIELLETIYFDEASENNQFSQNLSQLKELGVRIETDDFGTGRASMTGLLKIAPDRLKIDKSLVQEVVHSSQKRSLVKAIVEMANALDIDCLAEGVETQADIDAITALGCCKFQGYAISYPQSEEDLLAYLSTVPIAAPDRQGPNPDGSEDLSQIA